MDIRKNALFFRRGNLFRVLLFVYDIIMVNLAYYIAILMRFSDSRSFKEAGVRFMGKMLKFAPWYTVGCLIIFLLFHLYSGVWRYAGFNDFKKLLLVNLITFALYVCGSFIVVGRMPITVYAIGAILQFIMMGLARLAPRYILDSRGRFRAGRKDEAIIPLMIVGIGENTRIIQSKIVRDRSNIVKPVCVIDYDYGLNGKSFNGLPVFSGLDGVKECMDRFDIRCVVIAESTLPTDFIGSIREICDKRDIELRDFMIGTDRVRGVDIRELLEASDSPVVLVCDGEEDKRYQSGREALREYRGGGIIEKVSVSADAIRISVRDTAAVHSGSGEDWIEKYREETGSDVSFF